MMNTIATVVIMRASRMDVNAIANVGVCRKQGARCQWGLTTPLPRTGPLNGRVEEVDRVSVVLVSWSPSWRAPFLCSCPPVLSVPALRVHTGLGEAEGRGRRAARVAVDFGITVIVIGVMSTLTTGMFTNGDVMPVEVVAVIIPSSAASFTLDSAFGVPQLRLIPHEFSPAAHLHILRALTRPSRPIRRIVAGGGPGELTMGGRRGEGRRGGASRSPASIAVVVKSALTTVGVRVKVTDVVASSMMVTTPAMDAMRIVPAAAEEVRSPVEPAASGPPDGRPGRGRVVPSKPSMEAEVVRAIGGGITSDGIGVRSIKNVVANMPPTQVRG